MYTSKRYSFLVTHATLASDNPLRFRKNLMERIQKLIMTIDDKIRYEKQQCDINREAANISALSSANIDKNEFLTGKEILPPDPRRVIEQAKFAHSPLGKAFEKETKAIEEHGKRQVEAIEDLDPEKNQKLKSIEGLFPKK